MADALFRWIESTPLSVWTRESTSAFAFPATLSAHAIGMALAAGIGGTIALRTLGVARPIPRQGLGSFVPLMCAGFALNAVSGMLLFIAYPTKALTNPLFYVKLGCISLAITTFVRLGRRLRDGPDDVEREPAPPRLARTTAIVSLACWLGAIFAGRLLAYTHHRVLVDF